MMRKMARRTCRFEEEEEEEEKEEEEADGLNGSKMANIISRFLAGVT